MARRSPNFNNPLNSLQKRFVQEYLVDSKAGAAAKRAGYKGKYVSVTASRLLDDPRIIKAIEEADKSRIKRLNIDHERVLQELGCIAFANIQDIFQQDPETGEITVDIFSIHRQTAAALTEVTVEKYKGKTRIKVKLADKSAALVSLGKHLGMFKEQLEHSGKISLEKLIESSYKELPQPEPLLINPPITLPVTELITE